MSGGEPHEHEWFTLPWEDEEWCYCPATRPKEDQ